MKVSSICKARLIYVKCQKHSFNRINFMYRIHWHLGLLQNQTTTWQRMRHYSNESPLLCRLPSSSNRSKQSFSFLSTGNQISERIVQQSFCGPQHRKLLLELDSSRHPTEHQSFEHQLLKLFSNRTLLEIVCWEVQWNGVVSKSFD